MKLPSGFSWENASMEDVPQIKALIDQVTTEFGIQNAYSNFDSTKDFPNSSEGFFGLIKHLDKQIIATFALHRLSDEVVELRKMYLLPLYRSQGIGKWMLHFLIQKAKELGYQKIELQTASVLQAAMALYRKTGFDEVTSSNASPACDRAFELYL